ncbi:hypothetical protein NFA_14970 [Nocardia farcinica IFM 10152]|uniref:Uncharacterized protein n=3 Tax=Nocardia farcinica TaxID=37329 RepID=Q5YZP9_NOCFA|nr:hypothetical protein NFA_14970 [Nocardia farcinica IFM 10152]
MSGYYPPAALRKEIHLMQTLADAVAFTGVTVHDWLDHTAEIPRVSRAAAQGDVLILRVTLAPARTVMPSRVVVVASEASSHTHTLHPSGPCFYTPHTPAGAGDVLLGLLTVPEGSTAVLIHQEHGGLEILPGTYQVRRQRELADEWRMVAD